MAAAITAPVGKNGKNDKTDSLTIQCLLNAFIHVGRLKEPGQPPLKLLNCDSNPGPKTIKAIEVFQKAYMTEIGSCTLGRVDPHSDTLTRLLKNLDPPMGTYGGEFYGGACPTLPERPDLDDPDPAKDPHIVYVFNQIMYDGLGFCMGWTSKWAHLRAAGKDFPYDPVTRRARPPGADIIYAQNINKFDWWLHPDGFLQTMGQFRIGIGYPDFKWDAFVIEEPPAAGMRVDGDFASHLVARHSGIFLHIMIPRTKEPGHAIAYQHEQLEDGRSRFRIADPNYGQLLCNSAASFVDANSYLFRKFAYSYFDGAQRVFRVKKFGG
jgi:hypothetical protein